MTCCGTIACWFWTNTRWFRRAATSAKRWSVSPKTLSRCGCRVARSSALLPDLNQIAATFGQLLMAFFGADMPQAAYDGLKAHVANLPPGFPESAADEMRGLVLTHRDWIAADRARFGIAHQWRAACSASGTSCCVRCCRRLRSSHDHADIDARVIDIDGRRVPYKAQPIWSSVAAVGGLPATAMPIGRSAGGLPIGVQAIGPYLEDATSIRFAELAEREFGGFVAPPGW